jgi:hypothetical protein
MTGQYLLLSDAHLHGGTGVETLMELTAIQGVKAPAGIGILDIELGNDAVLVRNHADFAKLSGGNSGATIGNNVRLVSELPNVGCVAAVHLEGACRRAEFHHQDISILARNRRSKAILHARKPSAWGVCGWFASASNRVRGSVEI